MIGYRHLQSFRFLKETGNEWRQKTDAAKFDLENFFAEILSVSVATALEDEVTFCTSLTALKIK